MTSDSSSIQAPATSSDAASNSTQVAPAAPSPAEPTSTQMGPRTQNAAPKPATAAKKTEKPFTIADDLASFNPEDLI